MRAESVAKSIKMLKGILDGETYSAVAEEWGLSRSAVEQRVKALACELETVVGVEWVDEGEVPTVKAMRARKDNYLEALEHYHPQRVADTRKGPRALTDQDIERAVAVIRRQSNCRNRDTALLLVLFSTAARPLEIARLVISDYLTEDGLVREESLIRAVAAINGKARPLFSPPRRLLRRLTPIWKNGLGADRAPRSGRSIADLIRTAGCFSPGMDMRCR